MILKALKVLVCFLMVALAVASTLAVTFYQQHAFLRQDFERLQESYGQLQVSYISLQQDYQGLLTKFESLAGEYGELSSQYVTLSAQYSNLTGVFNQLLATYEELSQNYRVLSENYSALTALYATLQEKYFALNELYMQLQSNYTSLEKAYNSLSEQHEMLIRLWSEPLGYVVEPSVEELLEWLELDPTDSLAYDTEKFLCGDFTIMLIEHAKEKNWRMLFTVVEFDYYEENPNGISSHHGIHGHAFASIFTTEGIVYIEPQTDLVFYVYYEGQPYVHVEIPEWVFLNATDWLGGVVFVQYYNRMATPVENPPQTGFNIAIINQGETCKDIGFPK